MTFKIVGLSAWLLVLATSASAQISALAAGAGLPDGDLQMVTVFDYDSPGYKTYNVSKHGTSIALFDFSSGTQGNFSVQLVGSRLAIFDLARGTSRAYHVNRSGSSLRITNLEDANARKGAETVSLFTAGPIVTTTRTLPYTASPVGSMLQTLGRGLQDLAHDRAIRKQIEEQQQALDDLKSEFEQRQVTQPSAVSVPRRFGVGSTWLDVRRVQGHEDHADEINDGVVLQRWYYGDATVTFRDGKVIRWKDPSGRLKVSR